MELKKFQQTVLDTLDLYLNELGTQLAKTEKILKLNQGEIDPELLRRIPDFPAVTWERLRAQNALPSFRGDLPGRGRNQSRDA